MSLVLRIATTGVGETTPPVQAAVMGEDAGGSDAQGLILSTVLGATGNSPQARVLFPSCLLQECKHGPVPHHQPILHSLGGKGGLDKRVCIL